MSPQDLQPFIPLRNLPNWSWQQRTWIMGILNITPDSFSDGGHLQGVKGAISHACHMVQQGADIIDVGGQSTRPGATRLTTEEEVQRVIPLIRCQCSYCCMVMHAAHAQFLNCHSKHAGFCPGKSCMYLRAVHYCSLGQPCSHASLLG